MQENGERSTRLEAKHDPYAAFRDANFRFYTAASVLTSVGFGAQELAIGLEIYKRTGDEFLLGLVGLVVAVPMILFIFPAGYIADCFERKQVIRVSMLGMVAASLGMAAVSFLRGPVWLMFGLLFLNATASTLGRPARMAFLPQLVPRHLYENAIKWRTSTFQVAGMVGPTIGGFVAVYSVPAVYVFNAVTALVFIALLPFFRTDYAVSAPKKEPISLSTLLAGVQFVWNTRLLLTTMALDLFAVLLGGAVYLLPVFALDILQVGEKGLGWLRAAPAAGALVMALVLAYLPPMKRAGRNLLLSVAGFGVATILFGISRNFWLSMAMLFLTGALDNISVVVRHTLMQLLTPDAMRGRVSAVSAVFIGSSNELGGFESGTVAKLTNPVVSVVSGGIGTLLVVIGMAVGSPRLRKFGAMTDATPEDPVGVSNVQTAAGMREVKETTI